MRDHVALKVLEVTIKTEDGMVITIPASHVKGVVITPVLDDDFDYGLLTRSPIVGYSIDLNLFAPEFTLRNPAYPVVNHLTATKELGT